MMPGFYVDHYGKGYEVPRKIPKEWPETTKNIVKDWEESRTDCQANER